MKELQQTSQANIYIGLLSYHIYAQNITASTWRHFTMHFPKCLSAWLQSVILTIFTHVTPNMPTGSNKVYYVFKVTCIEMFLHSHPRNSYPHTFTPKTI